MVSLLNLLLPKEFVYIYFLKTMLPQLTFPRQNFSNLILQIHIPKSRSGYSFKEHIFLGIMILFPDEPNNVYNRNFSLSKKYTTITIQIMLYWFRVCKLVICQRRILFQSLGQKTVPPPLYSAILLAVFRWCRGRVKCGCRNQATSAVGKASALWWLWPHPIILRSVFKY